MLETTPHNANLRVLRAARVVDANAVDAVVLTGDCTDDGDGWELVAAAFRRWYERGRLLVIPGNHDLYRFPIASSARPRPTEESKLARWQEFAASAGLEIEPCGAWKRVFEEAGVVVAGLNSCARRQRAFFRQNGAIGPAQLEWLRGLATTAPWQAARHRIVLVHHHVVPLPHGMGKRAPTEIGMRLDDARALTETLAEGRAKPGRSRLELHGRGAVQRAPLARGSRFRAARRSLAHARLQERRCPVFLEGRARRARARHASADPGGGRGARKRPRHRSAAAWMSLAIRKPPPAGHCDSHEAPTDHDARPAPSLLAPFASHS